MNSTESWKHVEHDEWGICILILSNSVRRQITIPALLVVFFLFATFVRAGAVHAQTTVGTLQPFWTITHGGTRADEGWGVAVDDDGNVYFAGFDRIAKATADVFLMKTTSSGTVVWKTSWGGSFDDEAFVVTVKDGYVYVGGRTFTSFQLDSSNMML